MAGLSDLPGEILLHILGFLDPAQITTLQLVSRGFYNLARDNGFWRVRCLEESSFLEALDRRRRLLNLTDQDTRRAAQLLHGHGGSTGTTASWHGAGIDAALLAGLEEDDNDGEYDGDNSSGNGNGNGNNGTAAAARSRQTPAKGSGNGSGIYTTAESRERERVRIMANWDPCFPSERVAWYDEYVQRHGPVAVNWMQYASYYDEHNNNNNNNNNHHHHHHHPHRERAGAVSLADDFVEARGVALYYPDGAQAETVLAVAPLDDGGVALWDVGGTRGKRGAIVARSRPGILFVDGPGADNTRRSKRIDSGVTECVSVDSWQHRAFFAVQSHLIEVDLRRLSAVDCESFPWSITALSAASQGVPLTVGTSLGIHLHDYRARKPPRNDSGETVDGFGRVGAKEIYERSLRHIFDDEPLPPYAPLSQPGPLSILHLQRPGQEADLSDDIYVAGRFSNILHYDRRKFPSIRGSIHSGARLCSMTSLPYPFSTLDSELRRKGELSVEQVQASKSVEGGRTLVACGEYNTKGSLELYGLAADALTHAGAPGGLQNSTFKNRQTCSQSKLLSVVNHGTRLAFSDGSGYIKWFERDGFTEVRRCRIGHSERSRGPSIFASMPGSDDIARKLLPVRPAAVGGEGDGDGDGLGGGGGGRGNHNNDLLFWTGEKLGLVTFSARPGFRAEDFEESAVEAPGTEAVAAAQSEFSEKMRRALERQADDVRFVRNLGLDSGVRPASA